MKKQSKLIERFFQATEETDEAFLRALQNLVRSLEGSRRGESSTLRVHEPVKPYGADASLDAVPYTVSDALREVMRVSNWSLSEAAGRLNVSPDIMEQLLSQMMPLSASTAAGVAQFLSVQFRIPDPLAIRQWLINGLRDLEMESHPAPPEGHPSVRHAARRKRQ